MQAVYSHPFVPMSYTGVGRTLAAGAEVLERSMRRFAKPSFGIENLLVDGADVSVRETPVTIKPFCTLLHFERVGLPDTVSHPKVLLVAPMSGHWATLLRGTVQTMLADHDVYITDWHNARDVPLFDGTFSLDDYVDYVMEFCRTLGPDLHVIAVCQPAIPTLAALSLMAEDNDPRQPRSLTIMGGPVDTRINPTKVNLFAKDKTLDWFKSNVVGVVPFNHPGRGRRVYPGFLQLQGFMSLNLERHVGEHIGLFTNLVKGDGDSADDHRKFYDEYLAVMDLSADFYLDTIQKVFLEQHLAEGRLTWRGRSVRPEAISKTALFTLEGEKDDITGIGQTEAAHSLCSSLPISMRRHYLQPRVGHYGMFNGRRWREEIYPNVRNFILTHHG
jgi:poly(3-hydroxybutyrate) depolymerase